MIRVALIRHAPTGWNRDRRIQGQADTELSDEGRAMAQAWCLPPELRDFGWVTSTLARTRQTAALMGLQPESEDPRLNEMDWAEWTGRTLADLRAELGAEMAANEARGLDFRPVGGESPREVEKRLAAWLGERARLARDTGAITHRGVQRAALGLATGWDFLGKPPLKLARDTVLLLEIDDHGAATLGRTDLRLGTP